MVTDEFLCFTNITTVVESIVFPVALEKGVFVIFAVLVVFVVLVVSVPNKPFKESGGEVYIHRFLVLDNLHRDNNFA